MEEKSDLEDACLLNPEVPNAKRIRLGKNISGLCLWVVVFELANTLLFMGGAAVSMRLRRPTLNQSGEYQALAQFNQVWVEDPATLSYSDESWKTMALQYGIVSLSKEWVSEHRIPLSATTPGRPGEMVYQLNVFHSFHCLFLLRKYALADRESTSSSPTGHISHCLDYLRRVLTCNADITLGPATTTYDDYGVNSTRQCRDFDAVLQWVERNKWEDFLKWTLDHGINHLPSSGLPIAAMQGTD